MIIFGENHHSIHIGVLGKELRCEGHVVNSWGVTQQDIGLCATQGFQALGGCCQMTMGELRLLINNARMGKLCDFDTAETDKALSKIFATPEDKQKQELLSLLSTKSPQEIEALLEMIKGQ